MISVEEAKTIIQKNIFLLTPVMLPLVEAAQHILARDIFADFDIPSFQQSAMDGYAIRYADRLNALEVVGEMAAGTAQTIDIDVNQAARIFTGAPMPFGADTVVMQEKIIIENNKLIILDTAIRLAQHVRNKGAEILTGKVAMQQNGYLSPAAIGFLAGIGVTNVLVYPKAMVSIIVTGNELQKGGNQLLLGQVYESNSYSLRAALRQAGINNIHVSFVQDNLLLVQNALETALLNSDVVILTGGVSVGNYDFVVEATRLCNVVQQFHKIKQKPGKPIFFGVRQKKFVFGLPGNPSSVMSCFYNYVLPALDALSNKKTNIQKVQGELTSNYPKNKGLTQFLKGVFKNGMATPLSAQESFQLSSFAQADCLICLQEDHGDYQKGEMVEVYLLPY